MSLIIKDPVAIRKRRIKIGVVSIVVIAFIAIASITQNISQAPVIFRYVNEENDVFPEFSRNEFTVPNSTETGSMQITYLLETSEAFNSVHLIWYIFSCNLSTVVNGFDIENETSREEFALIYSVESGVVNGPEYHSPLFEIDSGKYVWVQWINSRPALTWSVYLSLSIFY